MICSISIDAEVYSRKDDFFNIKFLQLKASFVLLILQQQIVNNLQPLRYVRDWSNLTFAQERRSFKQETRHVVDFKLVHFVKL